MAIGRKRRNMTTTSEHAPLTQRAERYWVESRQPLASLVFIAPLLIIYEIGVLLLGVQNGADVFMRRLLDGLGFGQHFLLPVLTMCILLGWHHLAREPWKLSGGIFSGMAVESILLGIVLRMLSFVQNSLMTLSIGEKIKDAVGFLGAGIYEELLFRLILFSLVAWVCRRMGTTHRMSMILGVVISSLLFALAHHVGANGELFDAYYFIFRFIAGVFFSILFIYRGFGITAGSHAAYDILVGVFG
jgi:membrane protease YdiL (CAAX protease family)